MADNTKEDDKEVPKSNKKLILLGLVGLLVVGGSAGGGAYFFATKNAAQTVTDSVDKGGETEVSDLPSEAHYVALDPSFTVNFEDPGKAQFLQVSLQAMTRDPQVAAVIERNMPMIRNNLVLIFAARSSDDLDTVEGKEAFREEARLGIQEVVVNEGGEGEVEAVFFTSFVMQ